MADLLDYHTSPLVLILKIAAPLIFLLVLAIYVFPGSIILRRSGLSSIF